MGLYFSASPEAKELGRAKIKIKIRARVNLLKKTAHI
jgi:hypothetical protein